MTELERYAPQDDRRRTRGRSPAYPGISLRAAIERAEQLYKAEGKHSAPVRAVAAALGFANPGSGSATVAIAALKKFGLVEEERKDGERMLRLSSLAFDILLNPEPQAGLREAALLPPIHREMWEEYGTRLPSAETLRWKLVKRGFTESGVQDFLKVYRETLSYASLDTLAEGGTELGTPAGEERQAPASSAPGSGDASQQASIEARSSYASLPNVAMSAPPHMDVPHSRAAAPPAHGIRMPLRLAGGEMIYIEGEFPVSEAAFENFLQILNAMRPGLVRAE